MTRIEEIYAEVLPEMKAHDIEDTLANRCLFLEGFRDGMKEDTSDDCIEKSLYLLAISGEIFILKMKMYRNI